METFPAPNQPVVSCVVALDGGDRMAKEWAGSSSTYVHAIISQLAGLRPNASLEIASIIINSLPPTCKRPLLVRPFQPSATFLDSLPSLLGKGKARESTADIDYALLEGMTLGALMLTRRAAIATYLLVISSSDIPNNNFWDEETPNSLPLASLWPDILEGEDVEDSIIFSDAWQALTKKFTKGLPTPQDAEYAILLSGFQSGTGPGQTNKRPHSDSTSAYPSMTIGIASPHLTSHLNKKVKLSPAVKGEQALPMAGVQASAQPDTRISERDSITDFSMGLDQDYQLQPMVSLDEKLAGSQPTVVPSAAGTQMLKQQEPSGILSQQDIQTQREEIKNQMKQFMLHLRSKASKGEISQERAKLTVEKVRQEAAKKLQYMDLLESQQNASPDLGQVTLPLLDAQQPPLVPNQSQPLQPATLPQQPQHINAALAEKQASIPKTPVPSNLVASPQKSPSNLPVWSGAIQWSFVDPMNKSKKELAFYVDAVPLRASAAAELTNVQWPAILEVAHISPMGMSDLQKYSQDNRIQVVSFVKAQAAFVENLGLSQGQNDTLYQLLAKNLEGKGSVAVAKLPGSGTNRGIVIVALPGQSKLVGLVFLTTPLPPKTPGSGLPAPQGQMRQAQQQAFHQIIQQQMLTQQHPSTSTITSSPFQPSNQLPPQNQMIVGQPSAQQAFTFQPQPQQQQSQQQQQPSQQPTFSLPLGQANIIPNALITPLTDTQIQEMFLNLQSRQCQNQT